MKRDALYVFVLLLCSLHFLCVRFALGRRVLLRKSKFFFCHGIKVEQINMQSARLKSSNAVLGCTINSTCSRRGVPVCFTARQQHGFRKEA